MISVEVDGRRFIVTFDGEGNCNNIKQRKIHDPGRPWEAIYHAPYWHHSAKLGGPNTLPRRIIAAAREKEKAKALETRDQFREAHPETAQMWGDLDAGAPNHHDPTKRGFDPK